MHAGLRWRSTFAAMLFAAAASASAPSALDFFRAYAAHTDDLARRQFVVAAWPQLTPDDRLLARQLLAGTDAELGRYRLALADFPFDQREPPAVAIPLPATRPTIKLIEYHDFVDLQRVADAIPAAPAIAEAARGRRLVLINEAHHDAHTRELVLRLLPRLRSEGFNYFAAEALIEDGAALARRGYPVAASGTEYLHEPLYGEIVRTALRLGYAVVPYDPTTAVADRDLAEAENLYTRVFARDPNARLLVLAGYAHIDQSLGELGPVTPMAMRLAALTGIAPLSIDQTTFREIRPEPPHDIYRWVVDAYQPHEPAVLREQGSTGLWSGNPQLYDISVILPPAHGRARPDWVSLDGARHAYSIDTRLCATVLPCLVEARYADESADAIAADRYLFLTAPATSRLYLFPGTYRLRAGDARGHTLAERTIDVH